MIQFTVPQFIDIEDKIFGPITVRQFIISLVGVLLIALCYKLFDFTLFIIIGLFIFALTGLFAFVKVNGTAFHYFMLNIIQTLKKPRLRVWRKDDTLIHSLEFDQPVKAAAVAAAVRPYSLSRLNELSLIVDTQGSYQGEENDDVIITRNQTIPPDFS